MILLQVDPDVVKPGWTPLIITLLLGIVMVLLYLSMRKQFRNISIPREGDQDETTAPTAETQDREDPPTG
jgi:hypothetical protein